MNWTAAGVIVTAVIFLCGVIWKDLRAETRDAAEATRVQAVADDDAARKRLAEDEARIVRLIDVSLAKFELRRRTEESPVMQLSARDWLNIIGAIEKQFNGRYWLAEDARDAMAELRKLLDEHTEKLHARISDLRKEISHNGA